MPNNELTIRIGNLFVPPRLLPQLWYEGQLLSVTRGARWQLVVGGCHSVEAIKACARDIRDAYLALPTGWFLVDQRLAPGSPETPAQLAIVILRGRGTTGSRRLLAHLRGQWDVEMRQLANQLASANPSRGELELGGAVGFARQRREIAKKIRNRCELLARADAVLAEW